MNLNAITAGESGDGKTTYLYPYQTVDLAVVLVYGANTKRTQYRVAVKNFGRFLSFLTLILSAGVLCHLRKRYRLRHASFVSSLIDILIVFFGGIRLRVKHQLERIFLGFLLIVGVFVMTIWIEAVIFPSFLIGNHTINTFSKLADLNAPIYCSLEFKGNGHLLQEILK